MKREFDSLVENNTFEWQKATHKYMVRIRERLSL